MVCIYCHHDSKVTNSRPHKRNQLIWRRRQCLHCKRVWSTYEAADSASLVVVKSRDGQLRPFQRDGLFVSIFNSCQHRPTPIDDATALTAAALPKIYAAQVDGVIDAEKIAQLVAETLDLFDQAAAMHYKAFHHLL